MLRKRASVIRKRQPLRDLGLLEASLPLPLRSLSLAVAGPLTMPPKPSLPLHQLRCPAALAVVSELSPLVAPTMRMMKTMQRWRSENLTFWEDGFSVEDGELMRYDDPAHAQTLAAINSGHAPLDLLNIRFGQQVQVHVHRRTDEKYKPPPMKPFGGSGNRLGSPAPASFASSSRPQPAATTPHAGSQDFQVDADKPTTQLQIRLGDGQRMTARFNTHHTIADLRGYIKAANPGMSTRSYVLSASFPRSRSTTSRRRYRMQACSQRCRHSEVSVVFHRVVLSSLSINSFSPQSHSFLF